MKTIREGGQRILGGAGSIILKSGPIANDER